MSSAACIVTELRSKAGMSRRALAQAAGVPTSTISRIEEGLSDATIGMLDRLAKAAGRELEISDRAVGPTIADLATKATREDFDWLGARCVADWVYANPGRASAAIDDPPAPTGSIKFDNLLAGIAETIADDHGLARPGW